MTPRRSALIAAVVGVLALVAALLAVTLGRPAAARLAAESGAGLLPAAKGTPLPDLSAGVTGWINTPPLTDAALSGKVVLVDFWTASCINCRRTFPFLGALQRTYAGQGFTIVAVHSPEFAFEKPVSYVERSAKELGVTWPIAVDPEMTVWNAFQNQYWPADYLVDRQGRIRYLHAGEGDEQATEDSVRALLAEGGGTVGPARVTGAGPASTATPTPPAITAETYFGSQRPPTAGDPRGIKTTGRTTTAADYVQSAGSGGGVAVTVTARDVYTVIAPAEAGHPVTVEVLLDGQPVPAGRRGSDIRRDGNRTVIDVSQSDLLHVLSGTSIGTGRLTLTAPAGVRFYTLTFGA